MRNKMKNNNSDHKGFIRNSASISALVLIGKVLGFAKQAVIAWAFGANGLTDVYFSADGFTSMLGQIIGQSVSPAVLTQYVSIDEKEGKDSANRFIKNAYRISLVLGLLLAAISALLSGYICNIIGISYTDNQREQLRFFLLALLPIVVFTSLTGVSQGYLEGNRRFIPGRLSSLFFSVFIISFIILFRNSLGIKSMLTGFLAGYLAHSCFMLLLVYPRVTKVKAGNPFRNQHIKDWFKLLGPLLVGNSVVDLGHLVDRIVASSLAVGSVSALQYGQVISSDIVNAVIITTIGTVLLPSITKRVASNDEKANIRADLRDLMQTVSLLAGLVTVLYFVAGQDLVRVFFQRGSFTEHNTISVFHVSLCYSAGFLFMANREILIKTHFAFHDTVAPMINSIAGVVINLGLSILLSRFYGVAGIAIATSFSFLVVFVLSCITVKKHLTKNIINKAMIADGLKIIASVLLAVFAGNQLCGITAIQTGIIRLVVYSGIACILYLLTASILREKAVNRIIRKAKTLIKGNQ